VRLPGKALADLHGLPMVVHVLRRAQQATRVARVVVATDDRRIFKAVEAHGGDARMTRADHASGSDRVAEVAQALEWPPDAPIVNVQGDEPLVDPALIDRLVGAMSDPAVAVATAAAPLHAEEAGASQRVKVVTDPSGRALYFSRAPIPHGGPFRVHLGIYAYRAAVLRGFVALSPSPLERTERLEQLRILEAGVHIHVVDVPRAAPSVDTPADLARMRRIMAGIDARAPTG